MNKPASSGIIVGKLSVLMFLQFFVWGAWFATLAQCLGANGLADFAGNAYGAAPYGAIFAPLFLGLIADRFFPSQIVLGVLFITAGILLWLAHGAAVANQGSAMVWYMIGHMLCYMPTLGLGNTVAFANLSREDFPKVRVWGTVGWIIAGLTVGLLGWSSDLVILKLAAAVSVILGVFCFALPHTPAPSKGEPVNLRALLMIDAFKMLLRPSFFVFILCSTLICIPLAYYYGLTANYLSNAGFEQAASTMTLGQMSEIGFMLLIPFFFRKLGVKWMISIGMLAWVIRYLLFSFGAPDQVTWMLLAAIALHGICYDFFFVTGFMYADQAAPKQISGQVQSMLVFFTQGIGMYFGYKVAFKKFGEVTSYGSLDGAISEAREEKDLSFSDQLGAMFSREIPESVDSALVTEAMSQWKSFWMYPAIMAVVILAIFVLAFWDKTNTNSEKE